MGGGYDVMLQRPGLPLFLQFKLSDCMVRNTAAEAKMGYYTTPYYRMHIRASRHSAQQEMLLDLENSGNEVYYSAPAFHTPEELNHVYLNHMVRDKSLWLRPSIIGTLPDEREHYIAFKVPGNHRFCSESRLLDTKGDFGEFSRHIEASFKEKGEIALKKDQLQILAENLSHIAEKHRKISADRKRIFQQLLEKWHPLAQIAFYAHMLLDCQFFIVIEKTIMPPR